jgi:hypothetical protein
MVSVQTLIAIADASDHAAAFDEPNSISSRVMRRLQTIETSLIGYSD